MSKDISAIHRSLKSVKIRDRKPFNIHKVLTLIVFFGFLTVSIIYFSSGNNGITGKAIGNLNRCSIENSANPFAMGSFYCSHEFKNNTLILNLKYSESYDKSPVTIKTITVNSCSISPNLTMRGGKIEKIYTFQIPCDNIGMSEEIAFSFIKQESGIEYLLKGKIITIN